jgi:PAS domain S-box-containing protein
VPSRLNDENAAARLAGLLDSAMDAIVTVDDDQAIVMYNRAAERIFGWTAAEAIGRPLDMLLPERFRGAHREHMHRFGATGVTSRRMSGSSVVFGLRKNGEEFPVDASISQLDTPEGKLFTVILRDASDRVLAESEQARLAARLAGLLDSAMDGIVTVDEQLRIVMYNRAAERIFGWPQLQVMGQRLDMLLPARFRHSHSGHMKHFGMTGVTSRRMGADNLVIHGLRRTGEEFPMDASISQVEMPEGKLYTVILRDVSERVRAQEDLAAFAKQSTAIREQEMSRVARELHDELAQTLTAIKIDTMWVKDNLGAGSPAVAAKVGGMLGMIDDAVASTRRIAADLRPLVLDDLGLLPAIEWLVQNFQQRWKVAAALDAQEDLELAEPYATAVFRIVQESLTNVAKHAQAKHVKVSVHRADNGVRLKVQDDGAGFDPRGARRPTSLGLAGLRERAHLLKGSIVVHSQPGQGTTIDAFIPVREGPA